MSIKDILGKIGIRAGKRKAKKLAEYGVEKVQATLEENEGEEAYEEAIKTAINLINQHPRAVFEILAAIKEKVSPEVALNAVKQLPEEEKFTGKTVVKATEHLELGDEEIANIIDGTNLEYADQKAIVKHLEDEEMRKKIQQELREKEEQRCLGRLEKLYKMCDEDMHEVELENSLKKILKDINIDTEAIQEKINRIIARKIAFNYARFGTNIVSKQKEIMTAKEMNENSITQMAKEEYEKIVNTYENIKGDRIRPFNEEELNYNILKEIEANALTQEFDEGAAFKEIQSMMQTLMPSDRRYLLEKLKYQIENENIRETIKNIQESGIVEILSELPDKREKEALRSIKNVLEKTKNKIHIAKESPKIKSYKFNGEIQAKNGEER